MESEHLTISAERVTVRYEFKNESDRSEKTIVAFPFPPITCGYWGMNKGIDGIRLDYIKENSWVLNKKEEDFRIKIDGKEIKLQKQIKAIAIKPLTMSGQSTGAGSDITLNVQKAELPLDCREIFGNKKLFKKAQELGFADDYKGSDPEDIKFQTEITYFWEQEFPAGKTIVIEHQYLPLAGSGNGDLLDKYLPLHWNLDIRVREEERIGKLSDVFGYQVVDYILLTANTWKGPIKNFNLSLTGKPEEVFIGSSLGPLSSSGPNKATYAAENFVPASNLVVVFGKKSTAFKWETNDSSIARELLVQYLVDHPLSSLIDTHDNVVRLERLSGADLRIVKNAIFARKGFVFKSPELQDYFWKKPWYKPDSSGKAIQLNDTDRATIDFISVMEKKAQSRIPDSQKNREQTWGRGMK